MSATVTVNVPECISEYVIREVSAATFASIANFLDDACPGEHIDATLFRAAHVISFLRTKQDRPLLTTFLSTDRDRVYKIVKETDTETLIDAIYAFADGFSRNSSLRRSITSMRNSQSSRRSTRTKKKKTESRQL
jgi:hypothetical protein